MPTRRTSPRRTATRPSITHDRAAEPRFVDDGDDGDDRDRLAAAAPWLALLAIVLAAGALAFTLATRGAGGGDLTACRTSAWAAVPKADRLPAGWQIGSTDLNANGVTVSLVGPAPEDQTAQPPVVYASVTCYGEAATTALEQNRLGAEAAGATISERTASGDAYDVDNPSTGSVTTLFRVGGLIGQIADAGTAAPSELAAIATALATAMGDGTAAGTGGITPTDGASGSDDPAATDDPLGSAEPDPSAFAPELEAVLPTDIGGTPLTIQSNSATEIFGDDPSSRALGARIRAIGGTLDQLQVAQAYDDTGSIVASIVGFRLPGADGAKLRAAIVETWLSAGNDGVTTSTVELGGKSLTKIDYGDDGTVEYVYGTDDHVIVIDTSDVAIATEIASKLK
ncbi:MAG: hypothetical protein M3Q66_08285 [Chloroflexota bacterium]|nr:hypothetical protein [Chloroflexota bacterium]